MLVLYKVEPYQLNSKLEPTQLNFVLSSYIPAIRKYFKNY